ncbi:MAG: SIMPL domain-containing protein [Synechococcaceae cyanobacterium]|nr:SIMPL domain-containing protein [Synechococcaceae cyanobacterium]
MLRRTPPFLAGMAVLSLALVIAASILVRGVRRANDTITVTGASTERIRSDHVDWTVQVSGSGTSQQASWAALQPALASTISFLRAQGVKADELEQGAVRSESSEVRDPRTNELRSVSWTTRQSLRVSSWDVGRIRRISGRIGELIGQGIPLTIEEPAYTFTRLAEKRVDMLGKATRDARQRAGTIAREAGSAIGAITSADTGTFQITPPNSTEASNAGSYDTSTIDKDITAVMAVTFRVH